MGGFCLWFIRRSSRARGKSKIPISTVEKAPASAEAPLPEVGSDALSLKALGDASSAALSEEAAKRRRRKSSRRKPQMVVMLSSCSIGDQEATASVAEGAATQRRRRKSKRPHTLVVQAHRVLGAAAPEEAQCRVTLDRHGLPTVPVKLVDRSVAKQVIYATPEASGGHRSSAESFTDLAAAMIGSA